MAVIDPASPVPLYHQIAESIRDQIESGEIAPGDGLEPLRDAAERWGVNLHTVRHAYAALARDGIVETRRGRGGTRVLPTKPVVYSDLGAFLDDTARQAKSRFSLNRRELAAALLGRDSSESPLVWVVECSDWQCAKHAEEIKAHFAVDAKPWSLDRGEPPYGGILATYFHYNDIRRLWPRRLAEVTFITISPDPDLKRQIGVTERIIVCERDVMTAEAVVGDLAGLLGDNSLIIEPRVANNPAAMLDFLDSLPVLFPPRVWANLDESLRTHPNALELRYVLDPVELADTADRLGWLSALKLSAEEVSGEKEL